MIVMLFIKETLWPIIRPIFWYLVSGVLLLTLFVLGKWYYDRQLKAEVLQEYNKKQLEQVIKDNEILRKKLDELQVRQTEVLEKLTKKSAEIENEAQKMINEIEEPSVEDRDSSPVLKDTIRKLREQK